MTIKSILFFLSISALSSCSSQKMDLDRTFHDITSHGPHSDANWNKFYVLGGTASDWYNSNTGFNTEVMILIHYNHSANTRQIYPFITKYSLKSTVCGYSSIPPIDGVVYQATPGNKFMVEACDNGNPANLDDSFLKANSSDDLADWTRIYNNREGDTTLSPNHPYLQIEDVRDVTVGAATYSRYQVRIDGKVNNISHYLCGDIKTDGDPLGANPDWAMFIPAKVEATGDIIDYAGEYYKSLKLGAYNADHFSTLFERRDASLWSYVCDHRPTDCLLAQNGVSTASAPSLLKSSTTPDYVDSDGTWQFSADRDFNNCANTGCSNGTMDNSETDVDCGGGICSKCGTGKKCNDPIDCASNSCEPTGISGAKVCQDGHTAGADTPLPVSSPCNLSNNGADCYSGHCEANVPYNSLGSCRIGWFNDPCQKTTDCLSGSCYNDPFGDIRCAEGMTGSYCDGSNPCISGTCTNNVCAQGNEGARCWANSDCTTTRCITQYASAKGYCQLKAGGASCNSSSECFSGTCTKKKCVATPQGSACWQRADCSQPYICKNQDYNTPTPGACN